MARMRCPRPSTGVLMAQACFLLACLSSAAGWNAAGVRKGGLVTRNAKAMKNDPNYRKEFGKLGDPDALALPVVAHRRRVSERRAGRDPSV